MTTLRTTLRDGEAAAIAPLNGRLYAADGEGLDAGFARDIARSVASARADGWPKRPGDGVWLADDDAGALAGLLALTDEGDGLGRVRWFVLDPSLRGRGLGRTMLAALLTRAREAGLHRLWLETYDELRAAARLYEEAGFRVVTEEAQHRWGRDLTVRRYELDVSGP